MDLYCVIGNPVEHSKSPWIHSRFAALMGQSLDYQKLLVSLGEFSQAVDNFRSRGGRGCNITLPFKQEAAALATQRSARVELAQACNTLIFQGDQIVGENTDGLGLVSDIVGNAQTQISKRDVLVIGAGGAAAGILGPLLEQRPKCLWVANRTAHKAAGLVARHASLAHSLGVDCQAFGLSDAALLACNFDVLINASASSLNQDAPPVPGSLLRQGALACDLMYGPSADPFLKWAQSHGASARDGLGMLVEQAAESFHVWRGVRPPTAPVLAELRALLAQA